MSKRKICCFCERWASGGIESFLYNILLHMDLDKVEIHLVCAELHRNDLALRLEARGVQFIQLSGSLHKLSANHRIFRRLLRQQRYDVVHFHIYQGLSLYYCRIARQEGVPIRIAHSHNDSLRKSSTRQVKILLHRMGRRFFTKEATHLWACSQAASRFLFAREDFIHIPNAIDTQRFRFDDTIRQKVRGKFGFDTCFVIGNVGRLCSQKNQIFLLEVFTQVINTKPDSRLLLVGDGPDRDMLEKRAEALGIQSQTVFYGRSDKVQELLCAMDIFALPSLFEGLPLAAVEAQAAGLPVLCAQGLTKEVKLSEQLRFLPLDTAAWVEAITNLDAQKIHRCHFADAVRSAGFEASAVAKKIMETYLE